MSNVDPRRDDIPMSKAVTPGETWDFDVTVQEEQSDGTYDPAASFTAYDDWAFYILESLGIDRLATAGVYVSLAVSSGITVGSAPSITVQATATQTRAVPAGVTRAYELWATISGSTKRLAYGTLPVLA